jgi:hypothetical protein
MAAAKKRSTARVFSNVRRRKTFRQDLHFEAREEFKVPQVLQRVGMTTLSGRTPGGRFMRKTGMRTLVKVSPNLPNGTQTASVKVRLR